MLGGLAGFIKELKRTRRARRALDIHSTEFIGWWLDVGQRRRRELDVFVSRHGKATRLSQWGLTKP